MALDNSHIERYKTCQGNTVAVTVLVWAAVWVHTALVQKPIAGAIHLSCLAHNIIDQKCPHHTGLLLVLSTGMNSPWRNYTKCNIFLDARHFFTCFYPVVHKVLVQQKQQQKKPHTTKHPPNCNLPPWVYEPTPLQPKMKRNGTKSRHEM